MLVKDQQARSDSKDLLELFKNQRKRSYISKKTLESLESMQTEYCVAYFLHSIES
jgi:aryl-alcohol dehydrogenase-like predicted oxidoreductase